MKYQNSMPSAAAAFLCVFEVTVTLSKGRVTALPISKSVIALDPF